MWKASCGLKLITSNAIENHISWSQEGFSCFVEELFPSLNEEIRLPLPQGIFSNTNVNCTWSSHWHYCNARLLLLIGSQIIDLSISISRDYIVCHCNCSLIMQLKIRYTLCWYVPYINLVGISFNHYLRMWHWGVFESPNELDISLLSQEDYHPPLL